MSKSVVRTFSIYILLWLLSIVAYCSATRGRNNFREFGDERTSIADDGPQRWYFAESPFMIAKKQMSERDINSLLRNAWLG
ncbi:unnamed protein product [Gongylonema pulchrum]|uniref:Secreted protein n=1 Tax=Gongylonema pulchrum TaxID=637853 RepID=A0A183D9D3_9BILA|nr:unnamed protein product [Gongylonema pulchrum]